MVESSREIVTPRAAKLMFKNGRLKLRRGDPHVPGEWAGKPITEFQRARLLRTIPVLRQYLIRRKTVKRLAEEMGVTYQRVEQILALGLQFAEETGWLVR